MSFLTSSVPVWLLLISVAVAMAPSFLLFARLRRRFDGLAESVSNMDEWADVVEDKFAELEASQRESSFMSDYDNSNFVQRIARPIYR